MGKSFLLVGTLMADETRISPSETLTRARLTRCETRIWTSKATAESEAELIYRECRFLLFFHSFVIEMVA